MNLLSFPFFSFFFFKGGSIPHITREVLDLLIKEKIGIQITLPSTIQCFEGAKAFRKGIAEFVGLKVFRD